jgi:putative ABC transport system permease protein
VKYAPLIWSALCRKPFEALLTLLSIVAAFTLFGLMVGIDASARQYMESKRMDRVWVNARFFSGAISGLPLGTSAQLSRIDGVSGVGAARWFFGHHIDRRDSVSIMTMDEGMKNVWSATSITPAQWDALFTKPAGLLISEKAAAVRHLKPGDRYTVITDPGMRADGGVGWEFEILGVVPDQMDLFSDDGFMIGNARFVDNALPLSARGIGFFFQVAVKDPARAVEISRHIDDLFANSGTPTQTIPEKLQTQVDLNRGIDVATITWSIAGAGLLMILFLTGNAIARSVRERTPEFASLQSMGFRNAHVMWMVFVEAAIPCVAGAVLGVILAAQLARVSNRFLPGNLALFLSHWTPPWSYVMTVALSFSVLLAVAGSAIPLQRLRNMSVTDALAGG